jgi:hypothetical protein
MSGVVSTDGYIRVVLRRGDIPPLQKRTSRRPATISTLRTWATAAQSWLNDITRRKWRELRNNDKPEERQNKGEKIRPVDVACAALYLLLFVLLFPVASVDNDPTVTSQNVLLFFRPLRVGVVRANGQKREPVFQ